MTIKIYAYQIFRTYLKKRIVTWYYFLSKLDLKLIRIYIYKINFHFHFYNTEPLLTGRWSRKISLNAKYLVVHKSV